MKSVLIENHEDEQK